ncbi:5'-amp-activated protein kinase subunit beta-2 [Plakobranchus ocellatus]|uniref:5'-AMP-activated protein kinase subunit beta-1 n=1 Tax=Plakobranchus ocellatus TaxID=259542 RepID=A0AAV4DX57_9GAST|nr:5'-amp-activated protein kinase subunit beta-2 [Plakobranchus ocellatus]
MSLSLVQTQSEGESAPAASSESAEAGAATGAATEAEEAAGEPAAPSEEPASTTVPMEFKWEEGGDNVLVSGSFNSWQEKIALSKEGEVFTKMIDVPVGEHLYKFIVDDKWVINKNLPIKCDDDGLENNVLLVQPVS